MKNIDKSFSLLQLVLAGLKKDYPTKYVDWVCEECYEICRLGMRRMEEVTYYSKDRIMVLQDLRDIITELGKSGILKGENPIHVNIIGLTINGLSQNMFFEKYVDWYLSIYYKHGETGPGSENQE